MYIEKTTAAERLIISQAMYGIITNVERARRLLLNVIGDFFEDAEQKPISAPDAEHIQDMILTINDILWEAETGYGLTVGDDDTGGIKSELESAKRMLLVQKVERLRAKIDYKACQHLLDLDDEEALPLLEALAKEKG